MSTQAIVAGLLGAVTRFLLSFLVYGVALQNMMEGQMMEGFSRSEADMLWIPLMLSHLVGGLFLAFVFSRWAGITSFMGGLWAGGTIGLFISSMVGLELYGVSHLYKGATMLVFDIVAVTAMMAVTGGVVGWWLGRRQ